MDFVEHQARTPSEVRGHPFPGDTTPFDAETVDPLLAGFEVIAPSDIVACACGEHTNVSVSAQALGQIARMQFGAAVDVQTIPLDDDRQLHRAPAITRCRSGR